MRRFVAWCSIPLLVAALAQAGEKKRAFMGKVDVAGVTISTEQQAVTAVEAQLRGSGPWSEKEDQTAADGLGRALSAAGPWLPVFARTLAAHLEDPNVEQRTLAVFLVDRVAKELGAAPMLTALERSPALFDGVKPVGHPTNHPDLRWSLLMALGSAVTPKDTAALAVLRKAAKEPRGFWLLGALGRVDSVWLLAHAREVVPKTALGGALRAMPDTKARLSLIAALAPWTAEEKHAALAAPFWGLLDDAPQVRHALE